MLASFCECIASSSLQLIGLRSGNSVFFFTTFVAALVMKAYFRAVAAWFSDPAPAQAVAGITLLAFSMYTGYNVPEPYMTGALRWITHIDVCILCLPPYCDIDGHPWCF